MIQYTIALFGEDDKGGAGCDCCGRIASRAGGRWSGSSYQGAEVKPSGWRMAERKEATALKTGIPRSGSVNDPTAAPGEP